MSMKTKIDVYVTGQNRPDSVDALAESLVDFELSQPWSETLRMRVAGKLVDECKDTYYICTDENGKLLSRLWTGWGRHERPVANWGHFVTDENLRGQGIGRVVMAAWQQDMATRDDLPLALFCTASERITAFYRPYGWRCAKEGEVKGPLYFPLGDSPETFEEFCKQYYKPASSLVFKKATFEWRHEIDCLFKFYMYCHDLGYMPAGADSLETALIKGMNFEIIFTDSNIPVGLAHVLEDGTKDVRIHPDYLHLL